MLFWLNVSTIISWALANFVIKVLKLFLMVSFVIFRQENNTCILFGFHENNVYMIDMLNLHCNATCLNAFNEDFWLWHRRLNHISFDLYPELILRNRWRIPYLKFEKDNIYDVCQVEKQTKFSFKAIKDIMTSSPLELMYMDLFGPTKIKSLRGNRFVFVLFDDFLRYTWVFILETRDEAFSLFHVFRKRVEK